MALNNKTAAYDLSLFEPTVTEEIEKKEKNKKPKVEKLPEKEIHKIRYRRHNPIKLIFGSVGAAFVAFVIVFIIIGQVQLTELNQKINNAKDSLANQQSVYTQTQMAVQSSLSTSEIQQYAEETLGMTKATNAQKEFVTLSDGDKAEVSQETSDSIFGQVAKFFSSIWS